MPNHVGVHVMDMRLYEGEGRHEEQSGSGRQAGRQADITNRAQMMMTGMRAALTLLVAANTGSTADPQKVTNPDDEFKIS